MIDDLVEVYGSVTQRERFAAGRLSQDELKQIARKILFRAIDAPAYQRIKDVWHTDACWHESQSDRAWPRVHFHVMEDYAGPFTERQWLTWQALEAKLKTFPGRYSIREHVGVCGRCGAEKRRLSVLVSATYYGFQLSREYAL